MGWAPLTGGLLIGGSVTGTFSTIPRTSLVIDGAGESYGMLGRIRLSTGPGTSATLDNTGSICVQMIDSAMTWASASTNVRVGVQDPSPTTGLEDGTWDVYADVIGGTAAFLRNTVSRTMMTTGSKVIAHDQYIAIVLEMTARSGTDVLRFAIGTAPASHPYSTVDSGTLAKSAVLPVGLIEFGNGTLGFFHPLCLPFISPGLTYGSASAFDEHALLFTPQVGMKIKGLWASIGGLAAIDTADIVLYGTPLGTPTVLATVSTSGDVAVAPSVTAPNVIMLPIPEVTLVKGLDYAIGVIATATGTIYLQARSVLASSWTQQAFLKNVRRGSRANQTGAFTEESLLIPHVGFYLTALEAPV